MKNSHILIFLVVLPFFVSSQIDLNVELQIYPTGIIPGIKVEKFVSDKDALNARIGLQIIDHRDLGVHMNEEGDGYGLSLGWNHFLKNNQRGLFYGIRCDYWFNRIEWNDDLISGKSDVQVLQPTIALGYLFHFTNGFVLSPTLSFGREWNVKTQGEPTGQGSILLIGIQFGRRF